MFWQILKDMLPAFYVLLGVFLEKGWDLYQQKRKESSELTKTRFTSVLFPIYMYTGGFGRSCSEEPEYLSADYYRWICEKVDDILQKYSYVASGEMLDSYISFAMEVYDCVHSARDKMHNAEAEFDRFHDIVIDEYVSACKTLKKNIH